MIYPLRHVTFQGLSLTLYRFQARGQKRSFDKFSGQKQDFCIIIGSLTISAFKLGLYDSSAVKNICQAVGADFFLLNMLKVLNIFNLDNSMIFKIFWYFDKNLDCLSMRFEIELVVNFD